MKDGRPDSESRETPKRRLSDRSGGSPRQRRGYVERATAQGHSGRGTDSVLPHLRDQLRLKALLPSPFPMPDEERAGKDEHHQ